MRPLDESPAPFRRSGRGALATAAVLVAVGSGVLSTNAAEPLRLGLPIACTPGEDCVVQNYVDHDPGPDRRDHMCGHMTYDGHDGIDFRLPSMSAMRRGVMVLAAAPGHVRGLRNEVPDDGLERGAEAIAGVECGNGVVIDHGGGWSTQYCHMAQGSITVLPGQKVERGTVLGRVGYSGRTQFPHLHLTVRHEGAAVDPYAPDRPADVCGSGPTLWLPEVEKRLAYRSPFVLEAGFVAENVEIAHVEEFGLPSTRAHADQPALVAVARTIGIEKGDVMSLDLYDPSGRLVARKAPPPFDRPKAQWMLLAGLRKPAVVGYMPGNWHAQLRIERGGRTVIEKVFSIEMPTP